MNKTLEYYMSLPYPLEIVPDSAENTFAASYPDLPGCITSADTLEKVFSNAVEAKRTWFEAAIEDGITIPEPLPKTDISEYSGQFKLRMPKSLHRSIALHARMEGVSMNQYCLYLLTKNDAVYSEKNLSGLT